MGAQLLDLYVHQPAAASASTAAAAISRNYTVDPADSWAQRLEVQGFAGPVWVDAAGNQVGTASVMASQAARTITIAVPEATFGTPAGGWACTLALTGQDGQGGQDQARTFAATAQPYQFGLCPVGGTAPVCSIDPGAAPKVMDTVTPVGTSQAAELDPTQGPVVLRGVTVP